MGARLLCVCFARGERWRGWRVARVRACGLECAEVPPRTVVGKEQEDGRGSEPDRTSSAARGAARKGCG